MNASIQSLEEKRRALEKTKHDRVKVQNQIKSTTTEVGAESG